MGAIILPGMRRTVLMTRVVIVDDHRAVCELLGLLLTRQQPARYEVVGEGSTAREAIEICLRLRPDLLLLDLMLPDFNGVEVLTQLRGQIAGLRVVFFSGCVQKPLVAQAVALGADGYVLKAQPLKVLLDAVERVSVGGKHFDPAVMRSSKRRTPDLPEWEALTAREKEVARLVAQGKTTKEAAVILGVSVKTLDKHRTNMMRKLGLHDAVSVTRYVILSGLVPVD